MVHIHLPDPNNHDDDHDHSHGHGNVHKGAQGALWSALWVTIAFMLIEALGGYFSNSLALLSDAAHMLTDVGAMLLSLFAIWVSRRPSTHKMSFGYHRAEILGALASGLAIWLIAGILVYESVMRLQAPQEVNAPIVIVIASIGLIANLLSMRMLHHAKHENMNVKAAYIHMLSDAFGSIGAVVAGVVLYFTHWRPIDPIITIFFSALMLYGSWNLIKEAVSILMESTPENIDSALVLMDLQALPKVSEAHDLHIWTVSSGRLALSVHLVAVDGEVETQAILLSATQMLEVKYKILHTTIQIEEPSSFKNEACKDCN